MHPIIQLCIAVALMVIAVRAWPPLAYMLLGVMALLLVVKGFRRGSRAIRRNISSPWFEAVASFFIHVGVWLVVAAVADYFMLGTVSAVSIVLCLSGAYLVIAVVAKAANRIERR